LYLSVAVPHGAQHGTHLTQQAVAGFGLCDEVWFVAGSHAGGAFVARHS